MDLFIFPPPTFQLTAKCIFGLRVYSFLSETIPPRYLHVCCASIKQANKQHKALVRLDFLLINLLKASLFTTLSSPNRPW